MFNGDFAGPDCGIQGKAPILHRLNSPIPVISNQITKHTQTEAWNEHEHESLSIEDIPAEFHINMLERYFFQFNFYLTLTLCSFDLVMTFKASIRY